MDNCLLEAGLDGHHFYFLSYTNLR